ncbi:hypothetical protein J3R30DRAFT_3407796 [Lentinula aciculospora]|uniref:Uncharacterized protein n=1 Tax=Lentinula aciculospora TaxID=153920 RepID=A0A9W9DHW0_9AGAR|nr:hypothetical protein J3R30DRAFT_3407796 [Lentinula aciculospora]
MTPPIQTYFLSGGIKLSFTDSGAPPGSSNYTTVILLHGGAFNAYGFQKIPAYDHGLNLRTVLLRRRDYAGSTPYTPSEIAELEQGDIIFWERLSAQLGEFLKMFIERERIPKLFSGKRPSSFSQIDGRKGSRSGGVAILGWSGGCLPIVSFLGATQNRMFSEEQYNFLVEYIGDCILYGEVIYLPLQQGRCLIVLLDPSYHCFGYSLPPDNRNYIPWEDTASSPEEFFHAFSQWVSSYYDHPCYDPVNRRLQTTASINDLDGCRHKSDEISVSSWTHEDIIKGIEERPAKNEISTFLPEVQRCLRVLTDRALFDEKSVRYWFPDVEVTHIGGTRSNWICAWAMIETKKRYLQHRSTSCGSQSQNQAGDADIRSGGRRIRFFDMDGANHFAIRVTETSIQAHWDRAEDLMQLVAEAIQSHGHWLN